MSYIMLACIKVWRWLARRGLCTGWYAASCAQTAMLSLVRDWYARYINTMSNCACRDLSHYIIIIRLE